MSNSFKDSRMRKLAVLYGDQFSHKLSDKHPFPIGNNMQYGLKKHALKTGKDLAVYFASHCNNSDMFHDCTLNLFDRISVDFKRNVNHS